VLTNEGDRETYFVEGIHPELSGVGSPPPEFVRRYRTYFEKREPWSFPEALAGGSPRVQSVPPAAAR
jgi:hypothetical protein